MDNLNIKSAVFTAKSKHKRYERCCVENCKNTFGEGIKFFKFPRNLDLRKKWLENCNLPTAIEKIMFVCEKHFEEKFLGKRKLKANAVPTLYLSSSSSITPVNFSPLQLKKTISCVLPNCQNDNTRFRLFKFPKKYEQLQKWVAACNFDKEINVKNKFLCEKHFEIEFLGKKKLLLNAIPSKNLPENALNIYNFDQDDNVVPSNFTEVKKTEKSTETGLEISSTIPVILPIKNSYSNLLTSPDIDELSLEKIKEFPVLPKKHTEYEERLSESFVCQRCHKNEKNISYYKSLIEKLEERNLQLEKQNNFLLKQNKEYKKERKSKYILQKIDEMVDTNENSKIFCKMLLGQRSKNEEWSEEQKNLAQSLNYKSNSTYFFMRDGLGFTMPSKTSLHRWAPLKKLSPGYNNLIFNNLKTIIQKMDDFDKEAVILCDEVAIRKDLVYDPYLDQVEGLVDFGQDQRQNAIGKNVCVVMLRGLLSNWKYVLSYFVSGESGINAETLKDILTENIKISFSLGFKIRSVICDQGPNNRKCFRLLGITTIKPFFDWNNNRIYCIYDVPHLIKSLRNTLLKNNIIFENGIARWDVLEKLSELDSSSIVKMCPKITKKHIKPGSFDKMRVKYASQVFSKSVAAAIFTSIQLKKLPQNAKPTAEFILKIDRLFDCLNSRNLVEKNMYKQPLRKNNVVSNYLRSSSEFLKTLKLDKCVKNYCILGLRQSIQAVLLLSNDLFQTNKVHYLLTSRLNQDPIENLFCQIRAKGGNCKNPSVSEFNTRIARIMSMKLVSSSFTKNCEDDNDVLLDWKEEETLYLNSETTPDNDDDLISKDVFEEIEENENVVIMESLQPNNFIIEKSAKRYFVGYAINKIISNKFHCKSCEMKMIKRGESLSLPSEFLIFNKDYSNLTNTDSLYLKPPSDNFFEICELHLNIYTEYFTGKLHTKNIKKCILNSCIEKTKIIYPEWFEENPCKEHRLKVLDFLILVLLRKNCSWKAKTPATYFQCERLKNLMQ